jgi:lactate dehydrogenase-like 2-hydroxyacid dehydrogenase
MCGFKIVTLLSFPLEMQKKWFKEFLDPSSFELVQVSEYASEKEICEAVKGATCIFHGPGRFIDRQVLESAKGTQLFQFGSIGYDNIDLDAATEFGIPVANNPGWSAIPVAEHTIMAMLVLLKKTFYIHEALSRGVSVKDELRVPGNEQVFELYGKTVGILGLGNIGSNVARRLMPFGVKVYYFKRNRLTPKEENELGVTYRTLDELLEESDIFTVHVPLNNTTKGMIGRDQIAKLKSGSILINTARKDIVDEEALADALREGRLSGACLDVPRDDEDTKILHRRFEGVKNILYTPHMSGGTREAMIRSRKQPLENVARLFNGKKPLYIVNGV